MVAGELMNKIVLLYQIRKLTIHVKNVLQVAVIVFLWSLQHSKHCWGNLFLQVKLVRIIENLYEI